MGTAYLESWKLGTGLYPTGEDLYSAYMLRLRLGRLRHDSPVSKDIFVDKVLKHADSDVDVYTDPCIYRIVMSVGNRKFITMANCHIGLSAPGVELSISYQSFLNTQCPVILPRAASGGFVVVGNSRIHGLEVGDGFLRPLPPSW
ncbi:hypothetical protein K469DRAFT_684843 [Zopfia rhizophila CBS 207.26]|uniref:Uncharacterized protein n=1 Tax=Zopfia rhizophila CBS 207.26 TaxID=1314779 RepID=A0A6A6E832_9PEZI|nr:hypothetical protein K469DRAFT_684843 [Zopfia rhizophila CBS 207.26]